MNRLLAALFAVTVLAGCPVDTVGKVGIGVDAQGRLIGYLAVCDQHLDGATLSVHEAGATATDATEVVVGKWTSDRPVSEYAKWSLQGRTDGWATDTTVPPLDARRTYSLHGWTRDNSGSTVDVTFTPAQLRDLKPGEVYFFDHFDADKNQDVFATRSPAEFHKAACRP